MNKQGSQKLKTEIEVEMDRIKCVLCLATCSPDINRLVASGSIDNIIAEDEEIGRNEVTSEDIDPVKSHLNIKFLLGKILKIPKDICCSFLEKSGDPSSWLNCCNSCLILLKDAKGVYHQLKLLQNRYTKLKNEMKNTIVQSVQFEGNFDDNSESKVHNSVRSYIKNSFATPLLEEIKSEICSDLDEADTNSDFIYAEESGENLNSENGNAGTSFNSEFITTEFISVPMTENVKMEDVDGRESYTTVDELAEHQDDSDTGVGPFKCDSCGRVFSKSIYLKDHVKLRHTKVKPHKCTLCENSFATQTELKYHKQKHVESNKCKDCGKGFRTLLHLKIHERTHSRNTTTNQCGVCEKSFSRKTDLEKHLLYYSQRKCPSHKEVPSTEVSLVVMDFPTEEDPQSVVTTLCHSFNEQSQRKDTYGRYPCVICGDVFQTLHLLKQHKINERGNARHSNVCKTCGKGFSTEFNLKMHMEYGHPEGLIKTVRIEEKAENVQKQRPGRKTAVDNKSNLYSFLDEEQVAEESVQENFECEICDKGFITQEYLTDHMKSHSSATEEKSVACMVCGKTDSKKSNLKNHILTEHKTEVINGVPMGEQAIIKCPICNESYSTPADLSAHSSLVHKENPVILMCGICDTGFIEGTELLEHFKLHTEKTSFKCEMCGESFKSSNEYIGHMVVHVSLESVRCKICGVSYPETSALRHHFRTRHNEEELVLHYGGPKFFMCQFCGETFLKMSKLTKHNKQHDSKEAEPQKCGICLKICANGNYLWIHLKIHRERKRYQCKICEKSFSSNSSLVGHKLIHDGIKSFQCSECGICFRKKEHLRVHCVTHTGARNYQCNRCGKAFTQSTTLIRHMRIHPADKPFRCEVCEESFLDSTELKTHIETHRDEEGATYTCKICGATFQKRILLTAHVNKNHNSDNPQECRMCGETLPNLSAFKKHMNKAHPRLSCDICGKGFSRPAILKVHQKNHSMDNPNPAVENFQCESCNKSFKSKAGLKSHLRVHVIIEKNYECDHCLKKFACPEVLTRHIRTHSGERPYTCEICGKGFKRPANFAAHRNVHHGEKSFQCDICEKSFDTQSALNSHLKFHKDPSERPQRPVTLKTCHICGKVVKNLRSHLISHTGEKRYQCTICGKRFSQSSHLNEHSIVHSGEPRLICEICGKSFRSLRNLKAHKQIHNGDRKQFPCKTCGRMFGSTYNLKLHTRCHSGKITYPCQSCHKFYSSPGVLKVHTRIHTGEKPFKCHICAKSFTQAYTLTLHARKCNNEPKTRKRKSRQK